MDKKNARHRNGSRSTNPSTNPSRSPSYFTEDDPEVFIMAIRVVEFSVGGNKVRKIFALESTYSKEIIEFWELG